MLAASMADGLDRKLAATMVALWVGRMVAWTAAHLVERLAVVRAAQRVGQLDKPLADSTAGMKAVLTVVESAGCWGRSKALRLVDWTAMLWAVWKARLPAAMKECRWEALRAVN